MKWSSSIDFHRAAAASIEQWGAWLCVPQLQSISSVLWHQTYFTEKDNSLAYKLILRLKCYFFFLFPAPVKFPVPQKISHVCLPITYTGIISTQEQCCYLYSIRAKELLQMLGAHIFKFELLKDRPFLKDTLRDKKLTYTNSKHTAGLICLLQP